MAGTTTRYAFPYQSPTDPPSGADLGKNLAEAVETSLGGVDNRLTVTENSANKKPLVRLVGQTAQTLANTTDTAVQFASGSEEIDTHNFHSDTTNNTRITPNVAGYYRVSGNVYVQGSSVVTVLSGWLRKNGSTNIPPRFRQKPSAGGGAALNVQGDAIVQFNGTTDYIELMVNQLSGGSLNLSTGSDFTSTLECEYLRPL